MAIKFLNTVQVDTDVLYVDAANDRVGIGTTSPAADFVVSHEGTSGIEIEANFQMGVNSILSFDRTVGALAYETMRLEAGDFWFLVLGVERMRIDSAGNVGIGTNSPNAKLDIGGSGTLGSVTNKVISTIIDGGYSTLNSLQYNVNAFIGTTYGTSDIFAQTSGEVLKNFYTGLIAPNSYFNGARYSVVQGGAERLTVVQGGNVGIGTTSPGENLSIVGESTHAQLSLQAGPTTYAGYKFNIRSQAAEMGFYMEMGGTKLLKSYGYNNADSVGLGILNNEDLIYMKAGGNVGIGTNSPGAKLDVAGNIKIQSALLSNQENTDVDTGAETVASVAIATYTAAFFDFVIKKTTNVRSGTVYACHDGTNVEFTETSTNDLGDTSDVTLSVDISGTNMRLLATVTSDDWSVKSLIRAI